MAANPTVETLVKHSAASIGEGPHWEDSTGKLLYVDILENTVVRLDVDTKIEDKFQLDGNASVIIPCDNGGYVVSSQRKVCHLDWDTKVVTDIAEVPTNGKNDRFNDGKCDKNGRLWIGTMAEETAPAQVDFEKGSLYLLTKGAIKKCVSNVTISNGLAWSADNSIMYYIDSVPRHVYAYDYDLATGDIANKRVVVDFNQWTVEEAGYPDGMTIDQEGKLWVAGFFSSKVMQFDPVTGKMLRHIKVPGARTTSCCFGGKDHSDLYVTSSRFGMTDAQMAESDPLAGSVFKVTGLGAKGVPAYNYSR